MHPRNVTAAFFDRPENEANSVMLPHQDDRHAAAAAGPFSRDAEDRLDQLENQQRTPQDIRRVDNAFMGGSYLATLLWGLVCFGIVGGTIAVATLLFFMKRN